MRKNLFLTCLLTLVAVLGMSANDKWPITLTTANGLPGTDGQSWMKHYTSRLYTFDEEFTTLRFTVVQTTTSTKMPNNAEAYDGRATWGPGFAFFAISELRVRDAEGNLIDYIPTSNSEAPGDGSISYVNDGENTNSHFHTVYGKGAIDGDYHYLELNFADPIKSFSIEWDTRAGYPYNMPTYVGLTPGYSYWPMPEQELSVEKVTTLEELAQPGSLFVLEGHAEEWYDNDRQRTNPGGGFFEAPCLTTAKPSAFGIFSLIPVKDEENTYKVSYINDGHYIAAKNSAATGFIDWTMDSRKAMKITFEQDADNEGDFILTSLEKTLQLNQDAIMRMGCMANDDSVKNTAARPFAENFSIYKANIKGSTIAYQLQELISLAEYRLEENGAALKEYDDDGFEEALGEAIAAAKTKVADPAVSATDIIIAKNNINEALSSYYSLALFWWVDSITSVMDAIENGDILISTAPNWINNSYSADFELVMQEAIDNADIVYDTYTSLVDIDEAIDYMKKVLSDFWGSKITNVKSLPFRIGSENDALPGDIADYGGYVWESPIYYLTETIDQLRFTFFKTNCNSTYAGYPFVTLAEFELYDEAGNKIELTEDCFTVNSLAKNDGGKGIAGMLDGNTSTYYHGAYSSNEGYDNFNFADNPEYVYFDIELPVEIAALRYVQKGRVYGTSTRKNTPVDFAIGEYGVKILPDDVPFPDDNNAVLGTQITDVSQITDDGIYALMGLINSDPVNGTGEPGCFYQGISRFATYLQSPCAFSIKSTGDEDGTYYIQSLADGKYWSSEIDVDGWGAGVSTLYKSKAAKINIVPNNNDGLPNSFVLYQKNDTVKREIGGEPKNVPYIIMQDWGSNLGFFSVDDLSSNDKDGEGEWYIYRMTMDTPYAYWLANVVKSAIALGLEYSKDPGFYSQLGTFPDVLAKAQAYVNSENKKESEARAILAQFDEALANTENVERNPVVAGIYLFESAYPEYFKSQKVKKAMYYMENISAGGDYALAWKDIPEDIYAADSTFYFELIPATGDEKVQVWLDDEMITEELAADAYYIRLCGTQFYVMGRNGEEVGNLIGTTTEPYPYIVRPQKDGAFDLWNPEDFEGRFSLHCAGHNNGGGQSGTIVYFTAAQVQSWWYLRLMQATATGIETPVVEGAEVVSTTYYTTSGAASATPVKGVNIVKYVYSDGTVKSVKFFNK